MLLLKGRCISLFIGSNNYYTCSPIYFLKETFSSLEFDCCTFMTITCMLETLKFLGLKGVCLLVLMFNNFDYGQYVSVNAFP